MDSIEVKPRQFSLAEEDLRGRRERRREDLPREMWATEEKRYYMILQTSDGSFELFRRVGDWVLSRSLD